MAEKKKTVQTNQAQIEAARRAEVERPAKLAEQQAKLPVVKEALATAQVGARGTTGQTIFEKALAGLPAGLDPGAARGLAAMSARYGLEAAARNVYTGENIAYNISEQTKAEQGAVTGTENLITQYSTPVNIPDPIYETITEQYTSPEEIQAMINAALAKQKTELLGEQKKLAEQQKKTALEEFKASLTTMGLADLTDTIDEFIKNDYTASQIKLELPKTTAYKTRFPGMEALKTANRAINEATYISNERAYLQTLRAYGLDTATLGSLSALGTYIANEVSPREFEERVNLASDRVTQNPDVLNTFKSYYPEADKSSVVAYLLNPKAGIDLVKKQVRVAEIGAAAVAAGFKPTTISTTYGETLVPDTGDKTFNTIRAEFQKAKQLSDAQRSLAQIEGQTYSDVEAIEGVVGGDTQKLLASQQRAEREIARFSSRGGVTGSSLGSSINV